jgi:hypothetical protein
VDRLAGGPNGVQEQLPTSGCRRRLTARLIRDVGHLLLKSFWANEAVFQMMMLAYNLFLLFKIESLHISEYRQQIKTFRLKYVFLAAKVIRTARSVIMKLSEKYPHQDVYKNCLS